MEKFKNKYRIPSARLQNWDYGSPGLYFITICTKNRECYFGEIKNGEMNLNETGKIADQCWAEIPAHFKLVELGEFVIMPNHLHGIIIINESVSENVSVPEPVETGHALSLQPIAPPSIQNPKPHFRFRNQGKNTVSAMVGSFKSATTRLTPDDDFGWQPRFHDHIIRTHDDFLRISNYILNNPSNWNNDKFFK